MTHWSTAMKLVSATTCLLLCLAPFAASAQAASDEASVVWRLSPDGDWLAAVRAEPQVPRRDGELLLAPVHPQPGSGQIVGLVPLEPTRRVQAGVSLSASAADAGVPTFCSGLAGVMGVVPPGSDCLAAADAPLPRFDRAQTGVLWSATPSFSAALNYGISQQGEGAEGQLASWSLDSALGVGSLFPVAGVAGSGRDVSLAGAWQLSPSASLVLSGSLGEYALRTPGLAPFDVNQAAVQFGLRYGRFSGGITGRVVRPSAPNALGEFSGLDIGVSWRTPWQGEFALGARNVLSRGGETLLPDPDAALEEATARTPYVRYKQDL